MQLALIAFGKLKTPGLEQAAEHYLKNLRPWCRTEVIELKAAPIPDKSPATRLKIQKIEADLFLNEVKKLGSNVPYFLLDEKGSARPTREWADWLKTLEGKSKGMVVLGLGSSLGFSDELREKAQGLFSLGPQTLSYELTRVVLIEQLFRAFSVNRGHPYHNEG